MILVVFALILFGIGLGLSVSGLVSLKNHVAPMQVITRQYCYCILGILIMIFLSCFPSRILCKYFSKFFFFIFALTALAFSFNAEVKSSRRWLYFLWGIFAIF